MLDLGGHPLSTNLTLALEVGRLSFATGLLSGPLFGTLGGIRTGNRRALMAAVCGLTLAGEPLTVFAWLGREGMTAQESGSVVAYPALWLSELALGLLILASRRLQLWRDEGR